MSTSWRSCFFFGYVSYDVRSAYWRVNNKIKKNYSFSVNAMMVFISCGRAFKFTLVLRTRESTDALIMLDGVFMVFSAKE